MTDFLLWKNDIQNRYNPTSLTDTTTGSIHIATAVIGGVTTNSADKASQWEAYFNLRNKLLDVSDIHGAIIWPQSTTTQRDLLSGIHSGSNIFNITTDTHQMYTGSAWA